MRDQDDKEHKSSGTSPGNTDEAYPEIEYVVRERKPKIWRRVGCGIAVVVWLLVMLLPLFFITLAAQGEVRIGHLSDVPNPHEHPLLQVSLISRIDYRGLNIRNSTIDRDGDNMCIQTNVRYLLWNGEADPATFCDCYARLDSGSDWELVETIMDACD